MTAYRVETAFVMTPIAYGVISDLLHQKTLQLAVVQTEEQQKKIQDIYDTLISSFVLQLAVLKNLKNKKEKEKALYNLDIAMRFAFNNVYQAIYPGSNPTMQKNNDFWAALDQSSMPLVLKAFISFWNGTSQKLKELSDVSFEPDVFITNETHPLLAYYFSEANINKEALTPPSSANAAPSNTVSEPLIREAPYSYGYYFGRRPYWGSSYSSTTSFASGFFAGYLVSSLTYPSYYSPRVSSIACDGCSCSGLSDGKNDGTVFFAIGLVVLILALAALCVGSVWLASRIIGRPLEHLQKKEKMAKSVARIAITAVTMAFGLFAGMYLGFFMATALSLSTGGLAALMVVGAVIGACLAAPIGALLSKGITCLIAKIKYGHTNGDRWTSSNAQEGYLKNAGFQRDEIHEAMLDLRDPKEKLDDYVRVNELTDLDNFFDTAPVEQTIDLNAMMSRISMTAVEQQRNREPVNLAKTDEQLRYDVCSRYAELKELSVAPKTDRISMLNAIYEGRVAKLNCHTFFENKKMQVLVPDAYAPSAPPIAPRLAS